MLKKESNHLFILSLTCAFFIIALLSVFLYSTDKLIIDMSDITRSTYAPKPVYTPIENSAHLKIVSGRTINHYPIKKGIEHYTKSAPILSYDAGDIKQKDHPFFSDVREAATVIPKVAAASPLLTVGKLGDTFLWIAGHYAKALPNQPGE